MRHKDTKIKRDTKIEKELKEIKIHMNKPKKE